ncbi:MAG: prepilin-type N-terminal cleavage/methylation domain-containing protein [Candidatus Zixiibacteriota bacterium]
MIKKIRNNLGFTLMELMIASIIGIIATAAAVEIYIHQHKNWIIQEGVSDLQQNGRAGVDEIASKTRMAGYGIPFQGLEAIVSSGTPGTSIPDSITLVFLHEPMCTTTLSAPMPQPSAELKVQGDISCFHNDQWVYIYDPFADEGEFFVITQVQEAAFHIQHNTMVLSKKYPAGSELFTFDVFRYFVDNWSDSTHPRLMRQEHANSPDIYSDNISDLQIRYVLTDGTIVDTINMSRYVRQVDLVLVARTNKEDLLLKDYRYDTLTTSIQVRNLAL